MELKLDCSEHDGAMVITPAGEIDTRSARDLEAALVESVDQGRGSLLLDCTDLDYITSAGLRVLLMIGRRLHLEGGRLALCALNADVREVLAVAGMTQHFQILDDRAAGLRFLGREARFARRAGLALELLRERDASSARPTRRRPIGSDRERRAELAAEIIGDGQGRE